MNEPYLEKMPEGTIDLRPLIDDKRVLRNPHKGWYIHFVDGGFARKFYRDGIEKGDYLEDIPGINHLYLRATWAEFEPNEGEYRFELFDDIVKEWGKYGFRFALRFCCFIPSTVYATPKWVRDAGAKGTMVPKAPPRSPLIPSVQEDKWEPDYGDPIFLEKLENFIRAAAEHYDGDPLLEFIDVGSFGTYGEGHTSSGSNIEYPASVIKKHLDIHLKYFRKTPVIMNDDLFASAVRGESLEAAYKLVEYAARKGMGARDDSISVTSFVEKYGYDTLMNGQIFDKFYENAPIDLEFANYHMCDPRDWAEGFPLVEALKRTHASYAGFHHYPREWVRLYPYLFPYVANRLGYWYFPVKLVGEEYVSGMYTLCELHIENRGYARAYNPFTLTVRASSENGSYTLCTEEAANLKWLEGEHFVHKLKLDFTKVPKGEYELEIGLFEGERAIEFAVKTEFVNNGFVNLGKITVSEA